MADGDGRIRRFPSPAEALAERTGLTVASDSRVATMPAVSGFCRCRAVDALLPHDSNEHRVPVPGSAANVVSPPEQAGHDWRKVTGFEVAAICCLTA